MTCHQIFDNTLQKKHIERFQHKFERHSFLHKMGAEILSEISLRQKNAAGGILLDGYFHDVEAISTDAQIATSSEPYSDKTFDMILSNTTLQFVNDLPVEIKQYKDILNTEGLFAATIIGEYSLYELKQAFAFADQELYGGLFPRVMPMIESKSLLYILQRAGFQHCVSHTETITVSYSDLMTLLNDLRYMGFSNFLVAGRSNPLTRTFLECAEKYYIEHHTAEGKLLLSFDYIVVSGFNSSI